jgi:transposase
MIVGAFDVHRRQITFDWVDRATGEARPGADHPGHPRGAAVLAGRAASGWRRCRGGGLHRLAVCGRGAPGGRVTPHLAEPADTATLRGRKRRAKTDRADARHLRELLEQDRLPESWIPPAHLLDLRELVRLGKTLIDQRTQWKQRIHAVLFHHGLPKPPQAIGTQAGRVWLATVGLPPPSRLLVAIGLAEIDTADARLEPISGWLRAYAARQPGCRALLRELYGVGPLCAPTILAELGDARRFAGGDAVVGYAGLDLTVWSRTPSAALATWPARAPRCCAGRCLRRPSPAPGGPLPPTATTPRSKTACPPTARPCRWRASWPATPATSWSSWARRPWRRSAATSCPRWWLSRCPRLLEVTGVRAVPTAQQMGRGRLPQGSYRHTLAWTTQKDRAAAHPGGHPIDHLVAAPRREHPDKAGRPGTHHLTAALPEPARRRPT